MTSAVTNLTFSNQVLAGYHMDSKTDVLNLNNITGTYGTLTTNKDSVANKSYNYGGAGADSILANGRFNLNESFGLMVWTTMNNPNKGMLNKGPLGGDYGDWSIGNDRFYFHGSTYANVYGLDGAWHMLWMEFNKTSNTLCTSKDNGAMTCSSAPGGNLIGNNPIYIGVYYQASTWYGTFKIDEMIIYNGTITATQRTEYYNAFDTWGIGPTGGAQANISINQSTYNFTSAINSGNQTIWRTNQLYSAQTYDDTPTVKFSVDTASNCSMGVDNINFTAMSLRSNSTICAEVDSLTQTCTLNFTLPTGSNNLFLSCQQTQNTTSHSGALPITLLTVPPPPYLNFTTTTTANNTIKFITSSNITIETNNTNSNLYNYTRISIFNSTGTLVASNISRSNITILVINNLSPGIYYFNATSFNTTDGTLNITNTRIFKIYNITSGAIQTPTPNQNMSSKSFNITYNASTINDGATNVIYYNITLLNSTKGFNSTIKTNNSLNLYYDWKVNESRLLSGDYYIRITSVDATGNSTFIDQAITTNTLGVQTISPEDSALIGTSFVNITFNATGTNINFCNLYWELSLYSSKNISTTGTNQLDVTGITTTGTREFYVACQDSFGNLLTTPTQTVRFDISGAGAPGGGGGGGNSGSSQTDSTTTNPTTQPLSISDPAIAFYSTATFFLLMGGLLLIIIIISIVLFIKRK